MGGVGIEELFELFVELAIFRGLLLDGSSLLDGGFVIHLSVLSDY